MDPPIDPVCGNALQEAGEACDDGNARNSDGCDENCTATACGNGVVSDGEACDDGAANGNVGDGCRAGCILPTCGDGVRDPAAGEGCDDGNAQEGDGCDTNCTVTGCGNGILTSGETCDDGAQNSNSTADACRTTCVAASCGDAVADTGEACDDGNSVDEDGCDGRCKPSGWLFDGYAELLCGTSQADYVLMRRPPSHGYEALNVVTGATTEINAAAASCHLEEISSSDPATFWTEARGLRALPGLRQAWDVVPGGAWMIGVSTYLPSDEYPFPHRIGEYNAAGEGSQIGSHCVPWAVYSGTRGLAVYCPDVRTFQLLVWTPGAFDSRTTIPLSDYPGSDVVAPNAFLAYGSLGTRVAIQDFSTGWLWSVPLDGSGPPLKLSETVRWSSMTANEQALVFLTADGTLRRHVAGAADSDVMASGLVSQLHPRAGNIGNDWFRLGRNHGWVAYSQPGPQLHISNVADPSTTHALAEGAIQASGLPRFTDDGAFALYRLPSGLYAHPTTGGEAVLLDAFAVDYFTAGGSVVAWTRAEPASEVTGQLRVRDLASPDGHRVVADHVWRDGAVRVGAKKIAYVRNSPAEGGIEDSVFVRDLY